MVRLLPLPIRPLLRSFFTLLERTELMLSLTEEARRKALAQARRLMNEEGLT